MSFWSKILWSFLSHAAVILWPWSAVILWPWPHVKITPPPIWVVAWLRWAGPTCWLCWTHSVGKKETGPLRPGGYLLWQNNLTYLADTSLLKKERDLQTSPSHLFSNSEFISKFKGSRAWIMPWNVEGTNRIDRSKQLWENKEWKQNNLSTMTQSTHSCGIQLRSLKTMKRRSPSHNRCRHWWSSEHPNERGVQVEAGWS